MYLFIFGKHKEHVSLRFTPGTLAVLYIIIFVLVKASIWGIHLEFHGIEPVPGSCDFLNNFFLYRVVLLAVRFFDTYTHTHTHTHTSINF